MPPVKRFFEHKIEIIFPGFDAASQGEISVGLPSPIGLLCRQVSGEGPQSD